MLDKKFKNTGTSQFKRMFEALKADYIKIDEKKFEDQLVFTSKLSRSLNFYNEQNKIEGDWSHFFSDETVVLATILDADPSEIEKKFDTYIRKISLFKKEEKKQKYIKKCFAIIYDLARQFEYWHQRLLEVEEFTRFQLSIRSEISNAIHSKLAFALHQKKQLLHNQFSRKTKSLVEPDFDFELFSTIWDLDKGPNQKSIQSVSVEKELDEAVLLKELQKVFQSFYETLLYLKSKTPEYLSQSMESDIHYPEIALFLAFLKLFEHAKDNINQITHKHADFYFKEVLRQLPKQKKLDKIYLQFLLNEDTLFSKVPSKTKFIGEDPISNKDVYYELNHDILVNKAQIKSVNTLFIEQENLFKDNSSFQKTNDILEASLPIQQITPKKKEANEIHLKSFPAFGESQGKKGASEKSMSSAKVGFAISSPVLFLKGGRRDIEVAIQLDERSYDQLQTDLKTIGNSTGDEQQELFIKAFSEAFHIHLTVEKGWLEIKKYVVKKNDREKQLIFTFDLLNSDPAVIGYNSNDHQGHYHSILPILKFELNSETFIYPYTLLSNIKIEQVWFNVKVSNLRKLKLYNNIGQLSADAPFLPFGPQPKSGAYFIIGDDETFNKSLDDIKINIEWFDLPADKNGFESYYKAYNLGIDNTSFEVNLSVMEDGDWLPGSVNDQQRLKLFRSEENGVINNPKSADRLLNETKIAYIDTKKIKLSANFKDINRNQHLNADARRGYIKLELSQPRNGFGHDVYPSILSEAVMENAKRGFLKSKEKSKKEMPNAPYAPQIKTISLDYEATDAVSFIDSNTKEDPFKGELYHIHPFGLQRVRSKGGSHPTYILPEYNFEGAMYLGIAHLAPPQQLSILFEMIDEYTESSEEDLPEIEWSYLVNDEWKTLSPSRILQDDTNRFLKTGIILLDIPADIQNGNTVLASDLYWLRIAIKNNIETTSSLISLSTNVVEASLVDDNLPDGYLETPLPEFTIKRSVNSLTGIKEIKQPLASFQGSAAESKDQFYTRVSERLHHKGRAVTAWDYERILLDKFPQIAHVTCLSNMTSKTTDAPGNILLVVTPHAQYSASVNEPMASSELLFKIKDFISEFTSPFTKIEVRNPNYERIKIICAVKFTDGYNYGFYIQKLNEQINQYLRGTLLSRSKKVSLGGSIHSSDILSFMRTLPYVNFITKFSMVQVSRDLDGYYQLIDTAREGDKSSTLVATKPWSVLVPAPEHQISVLIDKTEERSRQAGIDYLELGHDFIIEE